MLVSLSFIMSYIGLAAYFVEFVYCGHLSVLRENGPYVVCLVLPKHLFSAVSDQKLCHTTAVVPYIF